MKKSLLTSLLICMTAFGTVGFAQCPFFSTPLYPSLSYNLDATPWNFELEVFGDTTNCQINWYRYPFGGSRSDAVLYTGPGSNTVSQCYPATDASVRNTHYNYYCVLTTPTCPEGIASADFDVQASYGSDCMTMDGMTFTIQTAPAGYHEGDQIKLTAYYSGYGGFHYFTWFFNGDTLKEDDNHIVYNDPDNFNYSVLTIPACEVNDAGSYSVRIKDGPNCEMRTSAKNITVTPNEYLVFDDNNNTHIWSDPLNWWPNYNRIPVLTDSAVIRKPCQVDIKDAKVRNLLIDLSGQTALTIRPTAALIIAGRLYGCKMGDLLIEADANGNGALVLATANTSIPATVQFYARSEQKGAAEPVWQYMGSPMANKPLLSELYADAALYEWTNTPNVQLGGNWQAIDMASRQAEPFNGYCMTQTAKQTYSFSGNLNNPITKTITVPYNDQGTYPGFALLANSWVAPIDIASLTPADFGAADATVYIMNTGTYAQAIDQQPNMATGLGTDPGQYNAIPIHAAAYMPNALKVIPPMQGFFVHTTAATSLRLNYANAVYQPALTAVNTTPLRAPQPVTHNPSPVTHNPSVLRLRVSGFGHADELYVLVGEDFTTAFDNGWDGRKAYGRSPLTIAARTEDDALGVAAVPDPEGIQLLMTGGLDKYYTISVEIPDNPSPVTHNPSPVTDNPSPVTGNLYLYDRATGIYTPLVDGADYTYTFTGSVDDLSIVRKSASHDLQRPSATKWIENGRLYIRVDNHLYDACGRKIE